MAKVTNKDLTRIDQAIHAMRGTAHTLLDSDLASEIKGDAPAMNVVQDTVCSLNYHIGMLRKLWESETGKTYIG